MAGRPSKLALARAGALLDTDKAAAREYLRRVQAGVGRAVPYVQIVAAMEAVGRDEKAVVEDLLRSEHAEDT